MEFNIIQLMMVAVAAFFAGCLSSWRFIPSRTAFGRRKIATLLVSIFGYLASLYFMSRDTWYNATLSGIILSAIVALPFACTTVAAFLSNSSRMEFMALACATLFAVVGTSIFYLFYIVDEDEFAALLHLFITAIEFVIGTLLLVTGFLGRKKNRAVLDQSCQK